MLAHSLRLLVVSEDLEHVRLIRGLSAEGLRGTSVTVVPAADAGEALLRIQDGGYDLLILDERIGDTTGLALLGAAQRNPPDTPVLILTDDGDDETAIAAIRAGAADYLVKTRLSSDLLRNAVRHAFERRDTERLRREAEQALRESERRYRLLMEHASDGIVIFDRKGDLVSVNTRICEMLGYSREELRQSNARDIVSPLDPHPSPAFLELEEGESEIRERLYLRKDGTVVPVEVNARALDDGTIQGIVRDITERKRAEDALRRSEERFRIVVRATNDTVWDWDLVTDTVWMNEGMHLQFRYAPEEVGTSGDWWRDRIHPADRERVLAGVRMAFESDEPLWWDEYRFRRGDNSYAYIFDRAYIVRDDDGRAIRIMGAMMDITEREQAEEALRSSEEQYRSLFDTNPLPIWVLEPETLRFLAVNQAAVEHYGYPQERFLEMSLPDLLPADSGLALADLKRRIWTPPGAGPPAGTWHVRQDGSRIEVELSANRLMFRGRPGILLLANDVTQRRQAEESLRQNEEQLRQWQKIEAVGRLAGGIAHDFNNMINVISGYTQMLYRRMGEDDASRKNLDEIMKAAERATGLTRQLLTFSRKQPSAPQLVDVNDVVSGMAEMLQRLIGEDIELSLCCDPELSRIRADKSQLEQIVMNLAVNARDAMPGGGSLSVTTGEVELSPDQSLAKAGVKAGRHVVLSVRDTGTGMDSEVLAHLFEPFFTTKPAGRGTGLGLATVYGIVKQSGGHIEVLSELGQGTTFRVYFPSVDRVAKVAVTPVDDEAAPARGTGTVLLVEDEDVVRAFVCESLRNMGYDVVEARSGPEAIQTFEQGQAQVDVLLTDVVMPKMSGPELAHRLRRDHPELPVLYMSGYTEGLPLTPMGVLLEKPFTTAQLGDRVREALSTKPH
jgi:PAS domain S-box-containing protein